MVHAIEDTEISIGNSYIAEMATILDSFYQLANNHQASLWGGGWRKWVAT